VSSDGFCNQILLLYSVYQNLTIWLGFVGFNSGVPEIAFVVLWFHLQRYTHGPPLQQEFDEWFVLLADGILLPTFHALWPLWTLTFAVLKTQPTNSKIAWALCRVLWAIDQSNDICQQVKKIHLICILLPLPFHQRLFQLQLSSRHFSKQELECNPLPEFWSWPESVFPAPSCIWMKQIIERNTEGLDILVLM